MQFYQSGKLGASLNICGKIKKEPYKLAIVDRSAIGFRNRKVLIETEPIKLQIRTYKELICIDITAVARHDIILGIPWLRKHNPNIN